MSGKQRTPYQQEMDQVHLSEEKANETLQKMLVENRRLRQRDAEKAEKSFWRRPQVWGGAIAVAACAALMIALVSPGNGLKFTSIDSFTLPVAGYSRGMEGDSGTLESAFSLHADSLFPGWTAESEQVNEIPSGEEVYHLASLTLRKGEQTMQAEISDYLPPIMQEVTERQDVNEKKVLLARDESRNLYFAAWQEGDCYLVLTSDMQENDFLNVVKEILR